MPDEDLEINLVADFEGRGHGKMASRGPRDAVNEAPRAGPPNRLRSCQAWRVDSAPASIARLVSTQKCALHTCLS